MYNWYPQMKRKREKAKNIVRNYNSEVKVSKFDEKHNPIDPISSTSSKQKKP